MKRLLPIAASLAVLMGATTAQAGGHEHTEKSGHKCRGGFALNHGVKIKELMDREFTAEQIEVLASARLIMRGNDNLKVGDVTDNGDGYSVTIVTQDNSLVRELDLAKNGMKMDRYQKVLERMEERE